MKTSSIRIHPDEIRLEFIRASGPGGQKANKVATAVQLRFDAHNSKSISSEIRDQVLRLAGKRATSSGEIIIEARRFRTQRRNRDEALRRLYEIIEKASHLSAVRRESRRSQASKIRRLEEKKRRSEIKKLRGHRLLDD